MNFISILLVFLWASFCHSMENPAKQTVIVPLQIETLELVELERGWQKHFYIMEKDGTRGAKYLVSLSKERWNHISEGKSRKDNFSGGHDWEHFKKFHFTEKDVVYYDAKEKIYLVSSKKGDSFPTVLKKFNSGIDPSLHVLFPPKVLTPEFVIDSFINSFIAGLCKTSQRNKGVFYGTNDIFKIFGRYTNVSRTFHIDTIYPDCWDLREEFGPRPIAYEFSKSRFVKGKKTGEEISWQGHFDPEGNNDYNDEYAPTETIIFTGPAQKAPEKKSVTDVREFYSREKIKEYLDEHIDSIGNIDIFDLFFDDIANPKETECKELYEVLKFFLIEKGQLLKLKPLLATLDSFHSSIVSPQKRREALIRLKFGLEINFKGGDKVFNRRIAGTKTKFSVERQLLDSSPIGHFGLVLGSQMMFLKRWAYRYPKAFKTLPEPVRNASHRFARNFYSALFKNEAGFLGSFEGETKTYCLTFSKLLTFNDVLVLTIATPNTDETIDAFMIVEPSFNGGLKSFSKINFSPLQ